MPKGKSFNFILIVMNKNGKNEELQSRREFFKKAAKGALPILGAIVLANAPIIAKASETSTSCHGSCIAACMNGCTTTCHWTCKNTCKTWCSTHCSGTKLAN